MDQPVAFLALLLALAGSFCLYLSSANQRWRTYPLPGGLARPVSAILIATSLALLWRSMSPVVAVFTLGCWLMLFLVVLPYLGAWRSLHRKP
ncbi:hypothetical protein [Niveibacterium terrae]|uniref:hypothetical protein n=1 Tax=Niveibacterium terrae TaxID=3373598 RepID=UPI003A95D123